MPFRDGGPSIEQIKRELRDRNSMRELACDRCKDLESRGESIPDWAIEWWEGHKAEDEKKKKD